MNKLNKYEELMNKNDFDLNPMDFYFNDKNNKFNKALYMEIKERGRTILLAGHDVQPLNSKRFSVFKKYEV